MNPGLTVEEVLGLPAIIDLPTAGRALGIGRSKSYELAAAGQFPCRVHRIGTAWRIARADLLGLLGIDGRQ